jgi:hypothetical protein
MKLVERLNMYFKNNLDKGYEIPFATDEMPYFDRMSKLEDMPEVIQLAEDLYEKAKQDGSLADIKTQILMEEWLASKKDPKKLYITEIPRQEIQTVPWRDWYSYSGPGDRGLFKMRTRPVVSFLVNEFTRRQKAQELQRSKESKTGILDMKRLHQYKYEEDIFLFNTVLPIGKNHGFVMLIDLSSSMGQVFNSVVKQVYVLAMFCKRLAIPFSIYGFTETGSYPTVQTPFGNVSLLELADSTLSQGILDYRFSRLLDMNLASGGTPFSAALTMMPEILYKFREAHRVEILQFVILSDGDCNICTQDENTYILDHSTRLNVKTTDSFNGRHDYTSALYEIARARSGAKITNFFLTHSSSGVEEKKNIGGLDSLYKIDPTQMFGGQHRELFLMRKLAENFG